MRLLAIQSIAGLGFLNSDRDAISRNTYCPIGDFRRIQRPVRGLHTFVAGHFTPLHKANEFISPLFSFCGNVPDIICCPIFPVLLTHFLVNGLRIFPGGHLELLGDGVGALRVGVERLEERRLEERRLEERRLEERRLEERCLEERCLEELRRDFEENRLFSSIFPVRVSGLIHLKLVPEHIFPSALQSLSVLHDLLIYNNFIIKIIRRLFRRYRIVLV